MAIASIEVTLVITCAQNTIDDTPSAGNVVADREQTVHHSI